LSPDGAYRLEELLALLPDTELKRLAESLDCRDNIAAIRTTLLVPSDPEHGLAARIGRLNDDQQTVLRQLAGVLPPPAPEQVDESSPLIPLLEQGLLFALDMGLQARLYVPLEVQRLLSEERQQADPDLRLLLLATPDDEIERLEGIYLVEEDEDEGDEDEGDDLDEDLLLTRVGRLAQAMESRSTLREIYQSLPDAAQEVLGWTCEHCGPLSADEVEHLAKDATGFHGERAGVALGQLMRFGLLMSLNLDESGEVFVVPRSLRPVVLDLIDMNLSARAATLYESLVRAGQLGFPDEGPRGWGGDAMRALRQLTIDWVSGELEELPQEYGVAVGMQVLDPTARRPAAFASLLLDLSGETALARQALRLWLALVDDPWTMDLVEATGGHPEPVAAFFSRAGEREPSPEDSEIWFGHLFMLRAQLLFLLSVLSPGKWFPIEGLARLYHTLVARSTLANLTHELLSPDFPFEALPDYGIVIARDSRLTRIRSWIEGWLTEFATVLGAAETDPSGTLFRVHPDAFCVFRDSDVWFRAVWEDISRVVGEDLDIWMPIPNDPGPRTRGVADIWVSGSARVGVAPEAHLFDLLRLACWADPVTEPAGFGFEFTPASIERATEAGRDGEEMLLWLAVRLHGEIPPGIRTLFPQSSSPADGAVELWRQSAEARVLDLFGTLESWGASPPGQLLESIRSWGGAAKPALIAFIKARLEDGQLDDPRVQHACVLLGELGADSAAISLVEVARRAPNELIAHAASAACMRIGKACLEPLLAVAANTAAKKEERLLAAMALTGLATLHPETYGLVGETLLQAIENATRDQDLRTRLTLELCRMGHPQVEAIIEDMRSQDAWVSPEWRPEDALWLARISPCVWGSLLFSTPMAMLYLVSDEADDLTRESGVRDILRNAGLSTEAVLYGRPRPPAAPEE